MIKFSVLLSIYNKEDPKYLISSLNSIIDQTYVPNEILIIKDGILNNKLNRICDDYLNNYPKLFKFIQLPQNQGLGKALQIGVNSCTHSIIARMDTDDIAKSDRFQKQLDEFMNDSELALLGSYIDEFSDTPSSIHSIRMVPLTHIDIMEYAKKRNPFNHMTVMFRKNAVLDAGNYQPFHLCEDYYLWFRMLLKGYKMKNLPESLVYARVDKNMFQRRGGLKYFVQEIKLQNIFYKSNFISCFEYVRNVVIRMVVRLLPNKVRWLLYKKYLR